MLMSHALSIEKTIETYTTNCETGLSLEEAKTRLEKYGFNALPDKKKKSPIIKYLEHYKDILIIVLLVAGIVSGLLGEYLDAGIILFIVIVNATLSFIQETRAEKAVEALKNLETYYAKVIRDGETLQIETKELVPGDIIILENGDKVPADARLIESVSLEVTESVLTGEASSVKKDATLELGADTTLAERRNMLYKNTSVLYGRAKAIVIATGLDTEIGKISRLIQKQEKDESPLAEQLDHVGKRLSLAAGLIIIIIFGITLLKGQLDIKESFFTAVSLAVAAIPEGLPAIVTIVLAIGVSKLAKSKTIIKRLKAVETLGSTNYILTDKTGTLTLNQMQVTQIITPEKKYTFEGDNDLKSGYEQITDPQIEENLYWALKIAVLCNNADANHTSIVGTPIEGALLKAAQDANINIHEIREKYPRIHEIPFSSINRKMLVVVENPNDSQKVYVMAKGAPEVIETMVKNENILELNQELAERGYRTLALSYKELTKEELKKALELPNPQEVLSTYHDLAGIMAQKDPVRKEVKEALAKAKAAGIKTIVLTGDNRITATNVALELGLITNKHEVIDGGDIAEASDEELRNLLKTIKVFARVSPEQKLRITQLIKAQDNIVAVTGDGVNDAPAIKAADIGISMGISGTDVAKEVADMVLEDDNYATIVEAIRQGRIVYENLVKFVKYLISCNISEILTIGIAIAVGLPLPLVPIQILWINLVTDGMPALALGMEPGESDIMNRAPRNSKEHILTGQRWQKIVLESLLMTAGTLFAFFMGLKINYEAAQTAAFTTLVTAQLFHALTNRSDTHSAFSKKLGSNNKLFLIIFVSLIIQALVVFTSVGNIALKTVSLSSLMFLGSLVFGIIPFIALELSKLIKYKRI